MTGGFPLNEMRFVTGKPGTATITITVQDKSTSIEVTVGGAP